jgi:hypothetical protein
MGLFADLGVDMESQEATSFQDPEPGYYAYEISAAAVVNGTSKDESVVKFRITYALFNDDGTPAGSKDEWWTLFENYDEETELTEKSRGYLKGRLQDLGVSKPLNEVEESDLEGLRGTLRLIQKGDYTNIRNVKGEVTEAAPAKKAPAARGTTARPNPFKKG